MEPGEYRSSMIRKENDKQDWPQERYQVSLRNQRGPYGGDVQATLEFES